MYTIIVCHSYGGAIQGAWGNFATTGEARAHLLEDGWERDGVETNPYRFKSNPELEARIYPIRKKGSLRRCMSSRSRH